MRNGAEQGFPALLPSLPADIASNRRLVRIWDIHPIRLFAAGCRLFAVLITPVTFFVIDEEIEMSNIQFKRPLSRLLLASFAGISGIGNALAACSTDCDYLGYTMNSANCTAGSILRCPFDNSKVYCKETTCEDKGMKTCGSTCIETSQCCIDGDCSSDAKCVNNACVYCANFLYTSCYQYVTEFTPTRFYNSSAVLTGKVAADIEYHNAVKNENDWYCNNGECASICRSCQVGNTIKYITKNCPNPSVYSHYAEVVHKTYVLAQKYPTGYEDDYTPEWKNWCQKVLSTYENNLSAAGCLANSWSGAPDKTYLGSTGTYNYSKICSMD